MASVTQLPPAPPAPPSPLPPRRPRSFAGPIVLILLGIFFLFGNFGWIAWHDLVRWFAHYWPLLLIVWGIIKLIEYQSANRSGVRPRGIGAGGVLLIIFVVVVGLISTEAYRFNWQEFRDQMHIQGDVGPWWGHNYDYQDEIQQAFPAGASLQVQNQRGAVNVTVSDDNQIRITVHKRINADRQEQADNWNKTTRPQVTAGGSVVTLNANTQGAGDHWVSSDLDISIPRKASVVLSTRHGDISVMDRDGNAEITSQHGDVSVTDLSGSLKLNLDHSSARISNIGSDVAVQGRADDVSFDNIKGAIRLDGDFMENVRLSQIAKGVSFKSSRTELDFAKLDGSLNLDSGDLEADSMTGPLRLRTRSKDISVNGISGDVHLQNENGATEIHVNKVGNMEIASARGDIRIFIPEKSAFQIEAQAHDGEIESDFNQLKIDNGDSHSTATGSVGSGGPHLVLNNEHGAIDILKGEPMPAPPQPPSEKGPKAPRAPKAPTVPEETEN